MSFSQVYANADNNLLSPSQKILPKSAAPKIVSLMPRVQNEGLCPRAQTNLLNLNQPMSSFQPKSRYTDTSYLIFQQLKEGGLQCAFPAIWDLLHPGASGKVSLPDELPAGVEPLAEQPSKNGKKPAGQYKAKDSRKSAASGIPRKQSKIAEKRKNRRSLELKAVEEAPREEEEDVVSVRGEVGEEVGGAPVVPVDEKKLQICDMSGVAGRGDPRHVSVISSGDDEVQKDIQVAVDFHHRPNSEVEPVNRRSTTETNNNDVRCKSNNEPMPADSDVESVRTVTPGPVPPREVDRGKAPGVQIRRKQYDLYELPYLTGSEYSESDFTDTASSVGGEVELDAMSAASSMTVEYATVEVTQVRGFAGGLMDLSSRVTNSGCA